MADITVTATSVIPSTSATLRNVTFFETMTAGQVAYIQTEGVVPVVGKAEADGSATVRTVAGIVVTGGAAGQYGLLCTSDPALTLSGMTKGTTYIASGAAAGGIAPASDTTTGWYTTVLGPAVSSTVLKFSLNASGVAT